MIKKIFHVADIHIPNSEEQRPYSEMIKVFLKTLLEQTKGLKKSEIRIVLAGDIFDQKIKATNEAKTIFHNMLNTLNQIGKTYIVAGNHDMLENNKDRMDSLNPTFEIKGAYSNVVYIDKALNFKSGYVVDDNVIFALYSMHENFATPNIDGLKQEYPDAKIIGLYHGDIPGATTDVGRMSENGINTDEFKSCDCVMAGHIHKFQEIKKNGVPIVYAGSLFQKAADENTTGHGFVVWDMEDLSYKHVEVQNDYRTFKFKITSYEDVENDVERLINL